MSLSQNKLTLAVLSIAIFFLAVIGRLAYLQIFKGSEYTHFSETYSLKEIPIPAPRGTLYDRRGEVLATTRPSFTLLLNLSKVKNLSLLLEELAPLLDSTPELLQETLAHAKNSPKSRPVPLALNLSPSALARIQM